MKTLIEIRDILRNAGRFDIPGTDEQACDLADAIDAHLSAQAKVRVTQVEVDRAWDIYTGITGVFCSRDGMRNILEDFAARLSQVAQGEAVGEINCLVACRRLQTLVEEYEHGETGETFGDKEWLVHDFIAGSNVWSVFESLYAHPAERAAVPDGWVIVPRGPTKEMLYKGKNAADWWGGKGSPKDIYAAMLAAAPQPPEGE